jgi:uncharacterized membrane protein
MKSASLSTLLLVTLCSAVAWGADAPQGVTNMGNVRGGDVKAAQSIIEKKCTKCHSGKIVEDAIFANKDMIKIQKEMEKKGATLNANESEVLGIYWKQKYPLKK